MENHAPVPRSQVQPEDDALRWSPPHGIVSSRVARNPGSVSLLSSAFILANTWVVWIVGVSAFPLGGVTEGQVTGSLWPHCAAYISGPIAVNPFLETWTARFHNVMVA